MCAYVFCSEKANDTCDGIFKEVKVENNEQ
jgi:hypothetical protein